MDAAISVHTELGPGLLESAYESCLTHELAHRGLEVERQKAVPLRYRGTRVASGLRLDLLVSRCVIVEVKAVEDVLPVHRAQILTYLRLSDVRLGLLLDFNTVHMRDGIMRIIR